MRETMSFIPKEEIKKAPEFIDKDLEIEEVTAGEMPHKMLVQSNVENLALFQDKIQKQGGAQNPEEYLKYFDSARMFKQNRGFFDQEFNTDDMDKLASVVIEEGKNAVEILKDFYQQENGEAGLISEDEIIKLKPYAELIAKQQPKNLEIIKINEQVAKNLIQFSSKILSRARKIESDKKMKEAA